MYKMSVLKFKIPQAHAKCAMKMKEELELEKNDYRVKIFVVRKGVCKSVSQDW